MADWHGYFRQSAGAGWVLVGDAGHFKDFTPAQGISDALRQARKLADTIARGLGDGQLDGELHSWWRWRDRDANEMYWLARDMGVPGVSTPLITRLLRDIADDKAATHELLRVLNHDLRPSQLFTARRLLFAAARALRDRPDLASATLREAATAVRAEASRAKSRHTRPPGVSRQRPRTGTRPRAQARQSES